MEGAVDVLPRVTGPCCDVRVGGGQVDVVFVTVFSKQSAVAGFFVGVVIADVLCLPRSDCGVSVKEEEFWGG